MNNHFKRRTVNIYTLFLFTLFCPLIGSAQAVSNCFSLEKIKKMYTSTFLEINSMLFQENWEITGNATRVPFVLGNDTLLFENFSQWEYSLSVDKWVVSLYRKSEFSPVLNFQTSKTCYKNIKLNLEKNNAISRKTIADSTQNLQVFQLQPKMDIVFSSRNNVITVCNYAQLDSLIKIQIAENEKNKSILHNKQQLIQDVMEQADTLRNRENYEAAIEVLEQLMQEPFLGKEEMIEEAYRVNTKIAALKKELDVQNFNRYLKIANSAFEAEDYTTAKAYLFQAQQINNASPAVLDKLKEIKKIETMYITRKTSLFDYRLYQKNTSETIENTLYKKIKGYISGIDAGDIKFSYTLFTDTLPQNRSYYQIDTFSLRNNTQSLTPLDNKESLSLLLDKLIIRQPIPAVKIDYLYVNAATDFDYKFSWKSSRVKVNYNGKKIKISPHNTPSVEENTLKDYFRGSSNFPNGKYSIEKKKIFYQDTTYTTLALKKCYSVGPEAMVYSLLFPGLGSLMATQGKKGGGILTTSVLFYGIGIAGFLLQDKIEILRENKDITKYASWGAIGVGGIIHFGGIFAGLKQGMKNHRKAKILKEQLKENAIYIQEFPQ